MIDESDLEQELKSLRKENRRLKRELEATLIQLRRTDEFYRTSERVLTKAYLDLEAALLRSREMQEELNRTSRLAAVGEIAARVVHEVLNPMTSLLGRLQNMIRRYEVAADTDPVLLLHDIVDGWHQQHEQGGLLEWLTGPGESGAPRLEEDLADFEVVIEALRETRQLTFDDLQFLERTCVHMVKIINSMRSLSRTRHDQVNLNINALLVETVELLRDGLRRCGIAVRERYGRNLPQVYVDPGEMMQIFTNIIRNAQQAIRQGGTVEIETRLEQERVEIRITDSGPGIQLPPDQFDLIFEGGFTTKTREEGTGLGLAICRRFARKYHGDVLVEWSSPGRGTCFLIWLPLREKPGPRELEPEGALEAP